MNSHVITLRKLKWAHKVYVKYEPRDIFYRAAIALIERAKGDNPPLNIAEALAVLLQTWNKAYYQFRPFNRRHFAKLERILTKHRSELAACEQRSIEGFIQDDEKVVKKLFGNFESVLGPVGAAKCLHLVAPTFFPLWDRSIAKAYRLSLWASGWNANRYCDFMTITSDQVKSLGGEQRISREQGVSRNPLMAIDEYNYVTARGWKLR